MESPVLPVRTIRECLNTAEPVFVAAGTAKAALWFLAVGRDMTPALTDDLSKACAFSALKAAEAALPLLLDLAKARQIAILGTVALFLDDARRR